jgi:tritrans,polycis-undecaprenyl-diphosphate synthase [geranylgeranyl-diphosphate specific]
LAYGGRAELTQAMKKIAHNVKLGNLDVDQIDEDLITQHLYTNGLPDPDLIIRTSGSVRLSGFLMWQSSYSELYFTDVLWPSFRKIDLYRAVRDFQERKRNFGS